MAYGDLAEVSPKELTDVFHLAMHDLPVGTDDIGFKNTIRECGTQIAYNLSYEERLQLLAFLAEIAKSDGNVCAAEINALKEVAMAMGMSDREVESYFKPLD